YPSRPATAPAQRRTRCPTPRRLPTPCSTLVGSRVVRTRPPRRCTSTTPLRAGRPAASPTTGVADWTPACNSPGATTRTPRPPATPPRAGSHPPTTTTPPTSSPTPNPFTGLLKRRARSRSTPTTPATTSPRPPTTGPPAPAPTPAPPTATTTTATSANATTTPPRP